MDALSILKHNTDRFGMVTVLNVTLYEPNTNEPLLELETLKLSNISFDGSQKDARGGQDAGLLLQYPYGRTANIEMQDALASMESLSYLWGGSVVEGPTDYHKKLVHKVLTATDIITLDELKTGVVEDSLTIINKTTGEHVVITTDYTTDYVVDTTPLTEVTLIGATVGEELIIYYMATAQEANGFMPKRLALTSEDFPKVVKLVGKTIVIEQGSSKKVVVEIVIPRFQLNSNFAFTMEAEGEISTFDFSGVALVELETKEIITMTNLSRS